MGDAKRKEEVLTREQLAAVWEAEKRAEYLDEMAQIAFHALITSGGQVDEMVAGRAYTLARIFCTERDNQHAT